jgi:hypothetical protein
MSRQEQHLVVSHSVGDLVGRGIRERHTGVLGLEAVDQVAEDPTATAGAESVVSLLAEPAPAAGGDAGDEHAVALPQRGHRRARLDDRADCLVAEDRPRHDLRDVALEDV